MYAVIKTGGKQYRVAEGDTLEVEHLSVKGNRVTFTPVLVVTDEGKTIYGRKELRPYSVVAQVLGDAKGDKINMMKYRAKSGYTARQGHRQLYSLIEIVSIGTKESKTKSAAAEKAAATDSGEPQAAGGAGEPAKAEASSVDAGAGEGDQSERSAEAEAPS